MCVFFVSIRLSYIVWMIKNCFCWFRYVRIYLLWKKAAATAAYYSTLLWFFYDINAIDKKNCFFESFAFWIKYIFFFIAERKKTRTHQIEKKKSQRNSCMLLNVQLFSICIEYATKNIWKRTKISYFFRACSLSVSLELTISKTCRA